MVKWKLEIYPLINLFCDEKKEKHLQREINVGTGGYYWQTGITRTPMSTDTFAKNSVSLCLLFKSRVTFPFRADFSVFLMALVLLVLICIPPSCCLQRFLSRLWMIMRRHIVMTAHSGPKSLFTVWLTRIRYLLSVAKTWQSKTY